MKKKYVLFVVFVLLIVLTPVFAAGSSEDSANENKDVTIRFGWWGDAKRHEATLKAVELFEAKYPWIHVDPEYQGWDGWPTKFLTQAASGTLPDVVQDAGYVTYTKQQGSKYLDMKPYVGDVLRTDQFSKSLIETWCTDPATGELYLIPTGIQAWTTLQNTSLLEANGIKIPDGGWTWEDLIPAAKKLHEADPDAYMLNCSLETLCVWMLPMYIQQKVGGIVITDDSHLQFDESTLANYFQWVKDMFDVGGLQPRSEAMLYDGSPLENPKWAGGKLAISQFSSASYTWYVYNEYLEKNTEVVPSFKFKGKANNDTILVPPASFYAIPATTRHPREAVMLIDFLLNDPEAGRVQGTVRSIPANSEILALLNKENLVNPNITKAVKLGSPRACKKRGSSAVGNDINQKYYDYIEKIAYGKMTPQEAAKACYADVLKLCDSVH